VADSWNEANWQTLGLTAAAGLVDLPVDDQALPAGAAVSQASGAGERLPRTLLILAITLLACAIIISRRVDVFTNAQFYAEDGVVWFADAYSRGPLAALGLSYEGYFQIVARLAPVVAAPFGIARAPMIYNIGGLLLQVAPVTYFLTRRFETVVPSFWARVAVSAVYLLMPAPELNVDITSAQFHLAILATLVLIAAEPKRWYWIAFDLLAVALCGLSGPFVYILFPVALLCLLVRRRRFTAVLCAMLAVTLAAQVYASRLSLRTHYGLGASLHAFVLIICNRVILAGLFAEDGGSHVFLAGFPHATVVAGLICLVGLLVAGFAALRAPWELRLFALAAVGVVVGGLVDPLVGPSGNAWTVMAVSGGDERYFFMAQVAWLLTLLWVASRLPRVWMTRAAWGVVAAAFALGLLIAWRYPPFVNFNWPKEARTISTSAPGTKLVLPINPGGPWAIRITVK
jgi:hypothetical protein